MNPDANLLFYVNLTGETFYIISHRMKSQGIKLDLQQRVYNDLALCVCHPVALQKILKGSLNILQMNLSEVRTLLDRTVHSSIMTINTYSMEKLFELTLIATRYQYSVCQHPKDILLIALNHLDGIRSAITDPTAIQLCERLHQTLVSRLGRQNAMFMQDIRFAILSYLSDVKLKMTNLIKLGYQKTTGEFVKPFPDKVWRNEFRRPGTIEVFKLNDNDQDSGCSSETISPDQKDGTEVDWMMTNLTENDCIVEDNASHSHTGAFAENEMDQQDLDEDELLEVEYVENSFIEISELQQSKDTIIPESTLTIKFVAKNANLQHVSEARRLTFSYDPEGPRGISLGKSIYEIPGNADDDGEEGVQSSLMADSITDDDQDPDGLVAKSVRGLELCSILLGCKTEDNHHVSYKSGTTFQFSGEFEDVTNPRKQSLTLALSESSSMTQPGPGQCKKSGDFDGINVIQFDARADRFQSKAELRKISKELDVIGDDESMEVSERRNVFDLFEPTTVD